nr:DUF2992 family protein [Staphylococcus haemolyticus]
MYLGTEPDDGEVFYFLENYLLIMIDNTKTSIRTKRKKRKINPKRLKRQVAKEQKSPKNFTKAQIAIKEEQEKTKKLSKKKIRQIENGLKKEKDKLRKIKLKKNIKDINF